MQQYAALSSFSRIQTLLGAILMYPNSSPTWRSYGGAGGVITSSLSADLAPHHTVTVRDGATSRFRVDGVEWTGSMSAPSSATPARFQSTGTSSGAIGESVVCIGALDTPDIESLEAYLAAKWGL